MIPIIPNSAAVTASEKTKKIVKSIYYYVNYLIFLFVLLALIPSVIIGQFSFFGECPSVMNSFDLFLDIMKLTWFIWVPIVAVQIVLGIFFKRDKNFQNIKLRELLKNPVFYIAPVAVTTRLLIFIAANLA